jgi:hypothetical protein
MRQQVNHPNALHGVVEPKVLHHTRRKVFCHDIGLAKVEDETALIPVHTVSFLLQANTLRHGLKMQGGIPKIQARGLDTFVKQM